MTPLPTQGIPNTAAAGDTWRWAVGALLERYPAADGWTAALALRGPSGPAAVPVSRSALGGDVVTVPASTTATLLVGPSPAALLVTSADETERHTVQGGALAVTANIGTAQPLISVNRRRLALIEAALDGRVVSDADSYTILGRSITRTPLTELHALRNRYAWAVWREEHPGQLGPRRQVRFVG